MRYGIDVGEQLQMGLGRTPKRKLGHGGKRAHAGRKPKGEKAMAVHARRPKLTRHRPVHVTLRIAGRVGNARKWKLYRALREAAVLAAVRGKVRIVDVSIQQHHVHMVVEADDKRLLACGLQGFLISAARRINRTLGAPGNVFADRYHARQLTCPSDVRGTRVYVLNNFRHHERGTQDAPCDLFSSALSFDGWRDLDTDAILEVLPDSLGYERWPIVRPRSWLLREGWRTHGRLSCWERPRS
jgi:putative transposase